MARFGTGDPAIVRLLAEVPKTGGFASPPFGGFALEQHLYYASIRGRK